MSVIPTPKAIEAAWERYSALARVVANDRHLQEDQDAMSALERAHARWATAYIAWCRK